MLNRIAEKPLVFIVFMVVITLCTLFLIAALKNAKKHKGNRTVSQFILDESERLAQTSDKGSICCPKCYGINIQVLGENRKAFSASKAIGGAVLTGGIGLLAGFAGKKGKYDLLCSDCGCRFQAK